VIEVELVQVLLIVAPPRIPVSRASAKSAPSQRKKCSTVAVPCAAKANVKRAGANKWSCSSKFVFLLRKKWSEERVEFDPEKRWQAKVHRPKVPQYLYLPA
jgi:hypothetical protein